jgi:hypothetical protein
MIVIKHIFTNIFKLILSLAIAWKVMYIIKKKVRTTKQQPRPLLIEIEASVNVVDNDLVANIF